MAERFKAHAWKVCVPSQVPWVRIPLSPPQKEKIKSIYFLFKLVLFIFRYEKRYHNNNNTL